MAVLVFQNSISGHIWSIYQIFSHLNWSNMFPKLKNKTLKLTQPPFYRFFCTWPLFPSLENCGDHHSNHPWPPWDHPGLCLSPQNTPTTFWLVKPVWNILLKLDHFPRFQGKKIKKCRRNHHQSMFVSRRLATTRQGDRIPWRRDLFFFG